MDPTQILMIVVVLALTILVIFLGVQVYHILGEIRLSLRKTNKMLDDMGLITESIAKPISQASGFVTGLKSGMKLLSSFVTKDEEKESQKDKGK